MCLALVVGNMIGSGVFMLPASLAPLGWNGVFGWIVTIAGALCLAAVFARLAQALPHAGGPYAYTRAAFGPLVAFMVAWSYWISLWVGNAAIAIGAISYLSLFFAPIATVPGLHALLTCAAIWLLTAVNCAGMQAAGRVQVATTLLKLLPLIVVLVLAIVVVAGDGGATLMPFRSADITPAAITAAASLTLWGLLGLESATIPADGVEEPERTIPRATLWGTAITGAVYLLVCSAVALLLPQAVAARSSAPLADFVGLYLGGGAALAIAGFAAISALGALNGWILLQGELPWAMARDGVFPRWFASLSARGTPVRAHVASSLCLTGIVLLNYARSMADLFTFIALVATTASLVMYLACAAAALTLLKRRRLAATMPFAAVAVLALLYSLLTLYGAGAEAMGWGLVLLLAGLPLHLVMRRLAASPEAP